jgi:SagB-type dehydrogenase family enzyme
VWQALQGLDNGGSDEELLAEQVRQRDGAVGLSRFYYYLQVLSRRGLLLRSATCAGRRLATLMPLSPHFVFTAQRLAADRPYVLSRFAYIHTEGSEVLLESGLAHARVVLHDTRTAALVHALARPCRASDLAETVGDLSAADVEVLLSLLLHAAMIGETTNQGTSVEDDDPDLLTWEFHDLLFHARSREGRHDRLCGASHRFLGRLNPPPARNRLQSSEAQGLYRPDIERLQREDPPFSRILETRRSIRDYAPRPITARELGEFLYRVGRVRESSQEQVSTTGGFISLEFTSRPYPGGGGLSELELYVAVQACEGVAPGLYHYDSFDHQLDHIATPKTAVGGLLAAAGQGAGIPAQDLQVLLIVAARFQRIMWKYASTAYALILKDVGVLYQTMYLVATAMNLAPCAIGCGNADLFAVAAGTDYWAETSVGEFLLGSKP